MKGKFSIVVLLILILLFAIPASASLDMRNPSFEWNNFTGYPTNAGYSIVNTSTHCGDYSAYFEKTSGASAYALYHSETGHSVTTSDELSFWYKVEVLNATFQFGANTYTIISGSSGSDTQQIAEEDWIMDGEWHQYTWNPSYNNTGGPALQVGVRLYPDAIWGSTPKYVRVWIDDFAPSTTGCSLYESPDPSFNATPETGYPPLAVNFTDTSTAGTSPITSWLWDFNDYSSSSHPSNASHTFLMNGTYNVTMTVGDGVGSYTAFKNITVGEAPAIPGSYDLTVHVKDSAGVHIEGAHISLLVSNGTVLTNMTNAVGISNFIAVPGSAAAIVDVTKPGYPEYIEVFTIASSFTKEVTLGQPRIKLYVDVVDSIFGYFIQDFLFSVKNTTSGVWRNTTSSSGSKYVDSTGTSYEYPLSIGETIVVAASKAGYLSDSETVTITGDSAMTLYTVKLHLVNINGSAPSSGNFSLGIVAGSMTTGREIAGASVTINELGRMAATNEGGVAWFFNVPVGSYTVSVSAPGYQGGTTGVTGTNLETVMKRIDLLPTGFRQNENGTILDPDGNQYRPWDPDYGDGHGGYVPGGGTGNLTATEANDRAADAITIFLDNLVGIGGIVFFGLLYWFGKKILLT